MKTLRHQLQTNTIIPRAILGILVIIFIALIIPPVSQPTPSYLSSPPQHIQQSPITTIHHGDIFLTPAMLAHTDITQLRPYIIRQLIGQGFTDFIQTPYTSGNNVITSRAMGSGYEVLKPVTDFDDLDTRLQDNETLLTGDKLITLSEQIRSSRSGIYLFKTTQDLQNMGYHVISHRQRVNTDNDYRRHNIAQSFKLMDNVRIILPNEQLQFLEVAEYDEYERQNYVEGYAIVEGEEEKEYGGGICGASTAVYQGILTNRGLEVNKRRAHTKRFSDLYTAYINHEKITTPGIDSAIRYGLIDLRMTNITSNPIILVMNYDGSYEGIEEVFTLGMPAKQGSFHFIRGGMRRVTEEIDNPEGTGKITETVNAGGCYTWMINSEEVTSCYKEVR